MKLFESFVNKKNFLEYIAKLKNVCNNFNHRLIECGKMGTHSLYKVIVNPKGDRTICFLGGLGTNDDGSSYAILNFLEENVRLPTGLRLVILPVANPVNFVENKDDLNFTKFNENCKTLLESIEEEDVQLIHCLHENINKKEFCLRYTHHARLANDLKKLAERYFQICNISKESSNLRESIEKFMFQEYNVPYIITKIPDINFNKRVRYNKEAMKLVAHNL